MSACDILCLPSYREGFGNVLIEAAAVGLPSVASRIYGITDAVVDGETGLMHEPGDIQGMMRCLSDLLSNPQKCQELGRNGRERVRDVFSAERVEGLFFEFLQGCIEKPTTSDPKFDRRKNRR
jgi:glycosyltransferase involved in cell wall biosynthesis